MKRFVVGLACLVLLIGLSACGCAGTRCPAGWTYTYTPQGPGSGQWVVAPIYAP
jgi:hypothetical protein